MRIDDWPLERIMRLPDWCFGQRWPVGVFTKKAEAGSAWDISENSLPEICVLWEVTFVCTEIFLPASSFRLALGQALPTTTVQFDQLDPLLPGIGVTGAEPREIMGSAYGATALRLLRKPIQSAGRKVVLELTAGGVEAQDFQVLMVFSSLPREVPDWLFSAKAINL